MQINMKEYPIDAFREKDIYTWDEIIDKIIELEEENYKLKEYIEDREQQIEDNYVQVPSSVQCDVWDDDFIEF